MISHAILIAVDNYLTIVRVSLHRYHLMLQQGLRELGFIEPATCIAVIAAAGATMWASRSELYSTGHLYRSYCRRLGDSVGIANWAL